MWIESGRIGRGRVGVTRAAVICGLLFAGCSGDSTPAAAGEAAGSPAAETQATPAVGSPAELFPDGPGRALVLDNCSSCHAVACSVIGQRTDARWDSLKQDHRDKASDLSPEDLETIFGYLKEHFNDSKPEPAVPADFLAGGCTPF